MEHVVGPDHPDSQGHDNVDQLVLRQLAVDETAGKTQLHMWTIMLMMKIHDPSL